MKFPVWRTTLEVFDFVWRERRSAVRFSAIPAALFLVLNIAFALIYGASPESVSQENLELLGPALGLIALQLIFFLPMTVTWYRLVVLGEEEARRRPLFTLGRLEWRYLLWQLIFSLVTLSAFAAWILVDFILVELTKTVSGFIGILAVLWTFGGLLAVLLLMTRLSMVLVLVALDKPVSFKASWRMTKDVSWRLLGATALVVLAGLVVGVLFKLVGFILGAVLAIVTASTLKEMLAILDVAGQTASSLVTFLGLATLFGFAYQMLADSAAHIQETPAEPLPAS